MRRWGVEQVGHPRHGSDVEQVPNRYVEASTQARVRAAASSSSVGCRLCRPWPARRPRRRRPPSDAPVDNPGCRRPITAPALLPPELAFPPSLQTRTGLSAHHHSHPPSRLFIQTDSLPSPRTQDCQSAACPRSAQPLPRLVLTALPTRRTRHLRDPRRQRHLELHTVAILPHPNVRFLHTLILTLLELALQFALPLDISRRRLWRLTNAVQRLWRPLPRA